MDWRTLWLALVLVLLFPASVPGGAHVGTVPEPENDKAMESPTARVKPAESLTARVKRAESLTARVKRGKRVGLHAGPGGRRIGHIGARTRFGSPQVLAVHRRQGRWLAVKTETGGRGWIARGPAVDLGSTPVSLHADLSERELELRRGDRVLERMKVTVGRRGSRTPTGRFGVTDKLPGRRFSGYYGCCILALSERQGNPPPGWTGGDRMAIHGTNSPATIGKAASAGCLRGSDRELRRLMRRVPLGAPVTITR